MVQWPKWRMERMDQQMAHRVRSQWSRELGRNLTLAKGLPPRDKGAGRGCTQMECNQSECSRRRSTPQLNQNTTRSAWTAWATQNKNKEVYRVGKVQPHHLPTWLDDVSMHVTGVDLIMIRQAWYRACYSRSLAKDEVWTMRWEIEECIWLCK